MARWQGSAGSRLHARLVALFSLVAVAPAIVVAVFSVGFLHFGLEAWFSERISGALTTSLNVARSYLEEHKEVIRADALAMAADLNREGPALLGAPAMFQRLLDAQAALRSLTEAIVFQSNGQVIARTGLSFVLEMERLPPATLEQAAYGDVVVLTSDTDDRVRALVRLDNFIDAYLFVGRFVDAARARLHGPDPRGGRRVPLAAGPPLRHPGHLRGDLRRRGAAPAARRGRRRAGLRQPAGDARSCA